MSRPDDTARDCARCQHLTNKIVERAGICSESTVRTKSDKDSDQMSLLGSTSLFSLMIERIDASIDVLVEQVCCGLALAAVVSERTVSLLIRRIVSFEPVEGTDIKFSADSSSVSSVCLDRTCLTVSELCFSIKSIAN